MIDPVDHWSRYFAAGSSMRSTGEDAAETLDGAHRVVAARTAIMRQAMVSPWTADFGELARMLPEKIEVFLLAGTAIAEAWGDSRVLWMRPMQHLGAFAMRGRRPTIAELADLGERMALLMLRSVEASAKLGSAGLAPVRTQVRANVRRLERGRKSASGGRQKVSH